MSRTCCRLCQTTPIQHSEQLAPEDLPTTRQTFSSRRSNDFELLNVQLAEHSPNLDKLKLHRLRAVAIVLLETTLVRVSRMD